MTRSDRSFRVAWLLTPAAIGVCLMYFDTLWRGLWWDDYHALRPWTVEELRASFHGTWDPAHIWPVYLRPFSVAQYALGFTLFGVNAVALHAMSLIGLTVAAWMAGTIVRREGASTALAAGAAVLYAGHPAIVYSQGPWFYFQNHLLCTLVLLVAVIVWQRRRDHASVGQWWPLWACTIAGFLIQEDMVMIAPAVVAMQAARAAAVGDVRQPQPSLIAVSVVLPIALFVIRLMLLGELGGRDWPDAAGFGLNALRMVGRVLLVFQRQQQPLTFAASLASSIVLLAGVWMLAQRWRGRQTGAGASVALGAIGIPMFACFGLPLLLLSSPSRYHLLGLAAVLLLSAALDEIAQWLSPRAGMMAAVIAIGLIVLGGRDALSPLRACDAELLWSDEDVLSWDAVPAVTRQWLAAKPAACRDGQYRALTEAQVTITWRPFLASRSAGTALVPRNAVAATISVQSAVATTDQPVILSVTVNGAASGRITLNSAQAQTIRVPLMANYWTTLRRMHRVDVTHTGAPLSPGALELRMTSVEFAR